MRGPGRGHQRRALDQRLEVTGVIGGLHAGGCEENLSYSSPFDQHITDLLARAEAGGPGDVPPTAFDDEC